MTIPVRKDGPPKGTPVYRPPAPRTESAEGRKARKKIYNSVQWQRARKVKLARNPLCERCLANGVITPAGHVHHIQDLADRPDLAHDLDNLEALCIGCHSSETRRRMNSQPKD